MTHHRESRRKKRPVVKRKGLRLNKKKNKERRNRRKLRKLKKQGIAYETVRRPTRHLSKSITLS